MGPMQGHRVLHMAMDEAYTPYAFFILGREILPIESIL